MPTRSSYFACTPKGKSTLGRKESSPSNNNSVDGMFAECLYDYITLYLCFLVVYGYEILSRWTRVR